MYRILNCLTSILWTAAWVTLMCTRAAAQQVVAPAACSLLSQAEIEQAFGAGVRAGEDRLTSGSATACRFAAKDGGAIAILVRRIPGRDWAEEQIGRMVSNPRRFHEILSIGDRSFLYDMMGNGAALCIFHADYYFQVSAFRMGESSTISPALEALARTALTRFRGLFPSMPVL